MKKLYGVFSEKKFGLTYSKKQALDYVKKHGGEVRWVQDDPAYTSFDRPTFRMISLPLGEKFGVIRRSLDKKNPPDRDISITRTVHDDSSQSTLVMEKGKLVVMGNLPHNAAISFDDKNALKLYEWLRKTYGLK